MVYKIKKEEVVISLKSNITTGLTNQEAKLRLERDGSNVLKHEKAIPAYIRFLRQFKDFMIWILLGAAGISFITHEIADGFIILSIVLLNGVMGFVQENNAEKSMEALKNMQVAFAQVLRDGEIKQFPSAELVIGDIVQLSAGDVVPADGRLVEVASLRIEESQLTGESLPVDKISAVLDGPDLSLGDRANMCYATSKVSVGRGRMIVTEIGMNTEVGKIAGLLNESEEEKTPLQIKLGELGKMLGISAVVICALIFFLGIMQGRDVYKMLMLSISLAVAAIPEGLPAIVTIVLAMGVKRMIKANAIIRKLPAVETLGGASVICSDKTGTLTQNKMTVEKVYLGSLYDLGDEVYQTESMQRLVETAVYCNDATLNREDSHKSLGDPTEIALLDLGQKSTLMEGLQPLLPRVAEVPFDSNRKLMSTIHKKTSGFNVYIKGAADQLLPRCTMIWDEKGKREMTELERQGVLEIVGSLSQQALRVLGFAIRELESLPEVISSETIESDMIFVGLCGMIDPPRLEVKAAVAEAKSAGIKTVMITGDYKLTAIAIAKELGLYEPDDETLSGSELDALDEDAFMRIVEKVSVYARVSPYHKVRIVKALKSKGLIVAMTGDGVNDAPALKTADIGCAMGITGTDVSKEASDLILTDDNFATIVSAVKEGRTIFDNIRKAVNFLLASNIGEIITLLLAIVLGWEAPLLAIHILWINLVTDSFPALALGVEKGEADLMQRKPRDPKVSILGDGLGASILLQGLMIGFISLLAFSWGLKVDVATARTMTFLTLSMTQLAHSFNVRSRTISLFKMGMFTNKRLNQGVLISGLALWIVYGVPALRIVFKLELLSVYHLIVSILLGLSPLVIMEVYKTIRRQIKR